MIIFSELEFRSYASSLHLIVVNRKLLFVHLFILMEVYTVYEIEEWRLAVAALMAPA